MRRAERFVTRHSRELLAPVCLIVAAIVLSQQSTRFLTGDNAVNILGQAAPLAIVALGQMVVIITRGFDVSVGSVAALSAVVAATAVNGLGAVGIVAAPLVGLAAGLVNGVLVGRFGVQPIIATLGMLSIARGAALWVADGTAVALDDNPFSELGYGKVAGVPWSFVLTIAILLMVIAVTSRLRVGRRLYMLGSNPEAADLVGINRRRTLLFAYAVAGLLAGTAAAVFLARAGAGLPTEGNGLELSSIAAAVIGGTALTGGIGRPGFVLIGALFIQSLTNGLNLANTSPFVQDIILGTVIVIAGLADWAIRRVLVPRRSKGGVAA
jgi:ribose transport system permease protein